MFRTILRRGLRRTLKVLSKAAIRKHNIRIIAVSGWYGTWVLKESLYLALRDDYKVRRNTSDVHWDFSIPLTILGYKDVNYSFRGWMQIITSTIWVLLFEKTNPHVLILELDANQEDILKYWLGIITPEVLILGNTRPGMEDSESLLVQGLIDDGMLICSTEQKVKFELQNILDGDYTVLTHEEIRNKKYDLKGFFPPVIWDSLVLSIPVAEEFGIPHEEVVEKLSNFEIPEIKLQKAKVLIDGNKD